MFICVYVSLSPPQMPLQKLLFSATLTQNPEKLQLLDLHQPRLFSSTHTSTDMSTQNQESFHFPQTLSVSHIVHESNGAVILSRFHTHRLICACFTQEYYVPCTLSKKPLIILHFLLRLKFSPVLCFTNSRETAHR